MGAAAPVVVRVAVAFQEAVQSLLTVHHLEEVAVAVAVPEHLQTARLMSRASSK